MRTHILLILTIFTTQIVNADTPDSTIVKPPNTRVHILCATKTINHTDFEAQEQTVYSTNSSECQTDSRGAIVAVALAGGGGGQIGGDCPNDYPYMTEIVEHWGFGGVIQVMGIGAGSTYTCCKTPNLTVSMTTKWVEPENDGKCPNT